MLNLLCNIGVSHGVVDSYLTTCETKAPVTPLSGATSVTLVGEPLYQLDTHPFTFQTNYVKCTFHLMKSTAKT